MLTGRRRFRSLLVRAGLSTLIEYWLWTLSLQRLKGNVKNVLGGVGSVGSCGDTTQMEEPLSMLVGIV
jgi:hypothetical protein